jgi:dipicolinate synthase subunit A
MDIIINTVPSKILDKNLLAIVRQDALLIDLASIPGGVDFEYAKERGLKIIHELGIPGKTAYKTAAVYMYDCIMKLLGNP